MLAEVKAGMERGAAAPPRRIDVRKLRRDLNMSQEKFATRFGLDVRTVRQWEWGRRLPCGPTRVLLTVISYCPDAVIEALRAAAPEKRTPTVVS